MGLISLFASTHGRFLGTFEGETHKKIPRQNSNISIAQFHKMSSILTLS